ncbi:protein kinase domain-containing protein [Sutcliffiella deserti]|uniref:protein kinase domain-containing protein n=1 Tax=Sutcliffiella deserti TaxID=2875501 RepID=UPI001CBDCE5E|nr:serine/threonine-protein kinase [Sutcliffiella deserti]
MMNNTMKSQVGNLPQGTTIFGKWHQNSYTILKTLGYGATGHVYLTRNTSGYAALKISENSLSITSEVNVLRHFSKVRGYSLGPSLIDVDDWQQKKGGPTYSFYVMEYLEGEAFLKFIEKKGMEWAGILILQLLTDLQTLHEEGWVFGDLKPDNLIVTSNPSKVRLIDVGGTTIRGRAIKEFTEFYDRGYWGLGSRKAEPTYDLFAVAMIMVNTCYPKQFLKNGEGGLKQLTSVIQGNPWLMKHEKVIIRALSGKYDSAGAMKKDVLQVLSEAKPISTTQTKAKYTPQSRAGNYASRTSRHQQPKKATSSVKTTPKSKAKGVLETGVLLTIVLAAYFFYIYGQLL